MTEETGAPAEPIAVTELPTDAPKEFSSAKEAADYFTSLKSKKSPAESADDATADPELADKASADPVDDGTTAEDEGDEPEVPAIDPPRSWNKDVHERWSKLDRDTQEFLASRDSEDQKAIKRSLNEAADVRKAADAERQKAEQVRKEYEAKLPALMQTLQDAQAAQFSDIKTMADVARMAAEDPFRKIQWDVHQQNLQAVHQESQRAEQAKQSSEQSAWAAFVKAESEEFEKDVPEFADKAKKDELTAKAAGILRDLGFKDDELNELATGKRKIAIFDRRFQRLLFDRIKLDAIKAAPPKALKATVPPVVRPGTARPQGAANSERVKSLQDQLNRTGSLKVAQELRALQSQRRASQ